MSSGKNDPIGNAQAWDVVTIGGVACPGICKVGEFKRAHEWDVKRGKGSQGATITFTGRPPAKGSITFYLWTPAHFVAWDTFRTAFKYDATKQSIQATAIFHPSLDDIGITSVVVEAIGNIVHEGNQLYTIKVDLIEYFPPPKTSAVSTPTMSTDGNDGQNPAADVPDVQMQQLGQLMTQATAP